MFEDLFVGDEVAVASGVPVGRGGPLPAGALTLPRPRVVEDVAPWRDFGPGSVLVCADPLHECTTDCPAREDRTRAERNGVRLVGAGLVDEDGEELLEAHLVPRVTAADLVSTRPGAELGMLLAQVELGDADEVLVLEVAAAATRLASWAWLLSARAAAELASREVMNPTWPTGRRTPFETSVAGDEIAMRLGWTRRAGYQLVRQGRVLSGALTWTGEQVEAGVLDQSAAKVVVDVLEPVNLSV